MVNKDNNSKDDYNLIRNILDGKKVDDLTIYKKDNTYLRHEPINKCKSLNLSEENYIREAN